MTDASAITLLLVRCPGTTWEEQGRLCGCTDLPMSETGSVRLRSTLSGLSDATLDVIYTGPDEASIAAGGLVADRFGGKRKVITDLSEVDLGLWEGQRIEDLVGRYRRAFRQWSEDPSLVTPPEGETMGEARGRITGAFCRLLERARSAEQRAAFVLRPIAHAIVGLCAEEGSGRTVRQRMCSGADAEWVTLWCARVRAIRESIRAGAA